MREGRRVEGWNGQLGRQMEGWRDGWKEGRTDGQKDEIVVEGREGDSGEEGRKGMEGGRKHGRKKGEGKRMEWWRDISIMHGQEGLIAEEWLYFIY